MLEATNPKNLTCLGLVLLWKLKIFEYFRLSHLLIFVGSGPEALIVFLVVQVICSQKFFTLFAIFMSFFSIFDLSFHLLVSIVIHFCIASDAKLCFASVF